MAKKKILLIHTGGTIAMEGEQHLEPGHYASALVEQRFDDSVQPGFVGYRSASVV